jgi:hypothetical protein
MMLLGFVGFVLGLTSGWMNPAETFVSRSSAAEIDTAQASTSRTKPLSIPALTTNGRADAPEVVSESSETGGRAARKRRELNAKLRTSFAKPADLRTGTIMRDDDDDDDDEDEDSRLSMVTGLNVVSFPTV